jgi:UDP-3-O-[3-hydroxymyristoyl] N-acetylglucosamine deacetylase
MDGLPESLDLARGVVASPAAAMQRTLKAAIGCVGVGLHSGARVSMTLRPADAGTGIVFRRTDLGREIAARFDNVVDTRMCTVLGTADDAAVRVGTVEHVMAALFAEGVDNAIVELDGPEVPVVDGSAAPFVFLISCAGLLPQDARRQAISVTRTVRVEEGDAFLELRPAPGLAGLDIAMSIDFDAPAIGRQALSLLLSAGSFRTELAESRTFTLAQEIARLRAAGLARGGSLENAVVVDGARVLNPAGLRRPDEFVRHKLLDAVGDLALAGAPLHGRLIAHKSGHALNNRLLRALFADPAAWCLAEDVPFALPRRRAA